MKRFEHNHAIITIPEETRNEATIEVAGQSVPIKTRSPKALQLGEFVEECRGYADLLSNLADHVTRCSNDYDAKNDRFERMKRSVDEMKALDFDSDHALVYELQMKGNEAARDLSEREMARVAHARARKKFDQACKDIGSV